MMPKKINVAVGIDFVESIWIASSYEERNVVAYSINLLFHDVELSIVRIFDYDDAVGDLSDATLEALT